MQTKGHSASWLPKVGAGLIVCGLRLPHGNEEARGHMLLLWSILSAYGALALLRVSCVVSDNYLSSNYQKSLNSFLGKLNSTPIAKPSFT